MPAAESRNIERKIQMKTGLVLEGGAMRGMYTAGVLDVLMENEIVVDGVIGVSAGACFGCNYKSRQIGRSIRYNVKYCRDSRYVSIRSLLFSGDIYNAKFCYEELPAHLDPFDVETYQKNPAEFYVVATDVNTGKAVYQRLDKGDLNDVQWIRASASMPLVSRIVKIGEQELLDGGIADSVPFEWFIANGYEKNLVVLTQPKGYVKAKNPLMSLVRLRMRKYPKMIEAMANRHIEYNECLKRLEQREQEGNTLVIRPSVPLGIKRTEKNPEKLQAVYELGRKDAVAMLGKIREFLAKETQ